MDNFLTRFATKTKLLFVFMLLIYVSIIATYYNYYNKTVEIIIAEHTSKIRLIESSIYNETKYSEIISKIAEKKLQDELEESSYHLLDLYANNPDVLTWDLNTMKNDYRGADIYIIDDNLHIIASTIEEEIGMSFADYPSFSATLRSRLNGAKFRSDPINYSFLENELKKFSYIPTPDNKYLLELSVNLKDKYPELDRLNVLYLSKSLQNKYPFIEDIKIFKHNINSEKLTVLLKNKDNTNKQLSSIENNQLIREALEKNESREQTLTIGEESYTIKYIPYSSMQTKDTLMWWGSYVMEIVYKNTEIINSIKRQKVIFYESSALMTVFYLAFMCMFIYVSLKNKEISDTDYLTKLPNRRKFEEFMELKINEASRQNTKIAVFFFDLDDFKKVNDTYGHCMGDKLLQSIARRIKIKTPKNGLASRIGGDEFVCAISGLKSDDDLQDYAKTFSNIFEEDFTIDSIQIPMKSSIGVSIYPDHGHNAEKLVCKADTAMYHAKQNKFKNPNILSI